MILAAGIVEYAAVGAGGGGAVLILGALGVHFFKPSVLYADKRAAAREAEAAADASAAERARAAHLEAQAQIIAGLQSTIATMQSTQSETHRDALAQAKQLGKLESRSTGMERQIAELRDELGDRIRERDAAIAESVALQHTIAEQAAEIARRIDSNAEIMLDLGRVQTDLEAAEVEIAKLTRELKANEIELQARAMKIAGLEQSVHDLQDTLARNNPPDCPPFTPPDRG